MPKLYEYLGLIIFFYSNEHEPIHVHGQCDGRESKAEFFLEEGEIVEIRITEVKGSRPLMGKDLQNFKKVVDVYAGDIVQKWVDYFVYHRSIRPETITRKLL
ncbi:DUF4160 domain-containing protein [Hymenobacter caeli]|uniref:DUF4160 domain-containing protein n=1 Tax=Hymenobacter caeli TaxID=2735894 RepID=A0ABX2FMA3_9BACT|nr:DUF4160 domain-containing protein [Hymenobacter caeli]NRT17597.1 hypothetical protein [Hymenobacter caeli]